MAPSASYREEYFETGQTGFFTSYRKCFFLAIPKVNITSCDEMRHDETAMQAVALVNDGKTIITIHYGETDTHPLGHDDSEKEYLYRFCLR